MTPSRLTGMSCIRLPMRRWRELSLRPTARCDPVVPATFHPFRPRLGGRRPHHMGQHGGTTEGGRKDARTRRRRDAQTQRRAHTPHRHTTGQRAHSHAHSHAPAHACAHAPAPVPARAPRTRKRKRTLLCALQALTLTIFTGPMGFTGLVVRCHGWQPGGLGRASRPALACFLYRLAELMSCGSSLRPVRPQDSTTQSSAKSESAAWQFQRPRTRSPRAESLPFSAEATGPYLEVHE